MAEFCSECWNDYYCKEYTDEKFIFTKHETLCEGCGEYRRVVFATVEKRWQQKIWYIYLPLKRIYRLLRPFLQIFGFPYRLIKYRKELIEIIKNNKR